MYERQGTVETNLRSERDGWDIEGSWMYEGGINKGNVNCGVLCVIQMTKQIAHGVGVRGGPVFIP